jgi:hypothetical protein
MPIYEFYCRDCHMVFNFFARRVNTTAQRACSRLEATGSWLRFRHRMGRRRFRHVTALLRRPCGRCLEPPHIDSRTLNVATLCGSLPVGQMASRREGGT